MIICNKCGRENQKDYRFCLGCGNDLTVQLAQSQAEGHVKPAVVGAAVQDASYYATTHPVTSSQNIGEAPTMAPSGMMMGGRTGAPLHAQGGGSGAMANCPACGTPNPSSFAFCGNCGGRIAKSGPTPATVAPAQPVKQTKVIARLSLIRPDGSEGGTYDVVDSDSVIGRASGRLFEHDTYMSPNHTRMIFAPDHIILEDAGSLNGVFVRIIDQEPLYDGDIFRIGQELLKFDVIREAQLTEDGTEILGSPNPGYWGRLTLLVGKREEGSAFPLMGEEMVMGRERGDILFSDDGYVSGTHAKIALDQEGHVFLIDLGSSNGTFIRLREPRGVPYGTLILMGQQLFRIDPA